MKKLIVLKNIFLLISLLIGVKSDAQYSIQLNYSNLSDSVVYFRLRTFDDKLYIPKDTLKLNKDNIVISSKTPIYGGFYYLYFPKSRKRIELCLENNDKFKIKFDGNKPDSIITDNTRNQIQIAYQQLEIKYASVDSLYNVLLKKGNGTLTFKEQLFKEKKEALMKFRNNALKSLSDKSLLHKYFTTLNNIDSFKPNKKDYSGRTKFINQFNLKDPQLYFSPIYKQILYEYLSAYPLNGDSTLKGIDAIMAKLNCKDKSYMNSFNYFVSVLQNSTIKENYKAYSKFIENHLIKNKCPLPNKQKAEEYIKIYKRLQLINKTDKFIEINLKDSSGINQLLSETIKSNDFTILSFYDPTCDHCDIQMPELNETIKLLKNNYKIEINNFAICNTDKILENEWKRFIEKHKLNENHIHVILGDNLNIRTQYAAYSNPIFFLIDKNGNLLLKKATIKMIEKYIIESI